MRRSCILSAALAILLWSMPPVQAAPHANLTNIRYSVENGYSRVVLTFDGEVRYSPLAADGIVRLGFSGTAVAVPLRARRQVLNTGLVTAISVSPVAADSTVVAIMLRPATTYRCILPASGNALYIDVLPAGSRVAEPGQSSVPNRQASVVKAVVPQVSRTPVKPPVRENRAPAVKTPPPSTTKGGGVRLPSSSVVDIPAVAREQLRPETLPVKPRPEIREPARSGVSPEMAVVLSIIAVVLLTGSGATLALALRKKPAKTITPPQAARAQEPPSFREHLEPEGARPAPLTDEADEDDESEFVHDTSLQLARTFRRGSEEITLARRLHDRATPQWSGVRMDETLSKATTPNQRLHFARKLGVGRGEMDLAAKLRTIRPAEKREGIGS